MDLSEVSKLDAPAKVLKLSEAARIGARMHPQLIGQMAFELDGKTCFYCAAAYGRGYGKKGDWISDFVPSTEMQHSADAYHAQYGAHIHKDIWAGTVTREQVADRLEAIGF